MSLLYQRKLATNIEAETSGWPITGGVESLLGCLCLQFASFYAPRSTYLTEASWLSKEECLKVRVVEEVLIKVEVRKVASSASMLWDIEG